MPVFLTIVTVMIFTVSLMFGTKLTNFESFAAMLMACASSIAAVVTYEHRISKLEEKIEEAKIKNETLDKP